MARSIAKLHGHLLAVSVTGTLQHLLFSLIAGCWRSAIDAVRSSIQLQLAGRGKLQDDCEGVRALPAGAKKAFDVSTPNHMPQVFHVE